MPPIAVTTNYDSFFSSTTANYRSELEKNFIAYRPSGEVADHSYGHKELGGYTVQLNAEYGDNAPTKFFTPYGHADTTPAETVLPPRFDFRYTVSSATISDIEIKANQGKAKLFDLTETRIRMAVRSTVNLVGSEIYSDRTSFGGTPSPASRLASQRRPTAIPRAGRWAESPSPRTRGGRTTRRSTAAPSPHMASGVRPMTSCSTCS